MNNQIEKNEFRVFLVALRQRLEYFEGFTQIDIEGDGEISKEEFLAQIDRIQIWAGKIDDPILEFELMDADGHGTISFDEFCNWAVKRHLDVDGEIKTQVTDETEISPRDTAMNP